jgi:hypothetical protein
MFESGNRRLGVGVAAGLVACAGAALAGGQRDPVVSVGAVMPSVGPVATESLVCPQVVVDRIGADAFEAFDDVHKMMLINLANREGSDVIAPCFVPGTDDAVVAAFEAVFDRLNPDRYNQTSRWSGTVASGSANAFGEPITLTYSYAPDGTNVPSGVGEPAANSNLYAFLNGIYGGNPLVWQALYDQVFDRWEEISGLNYVFEPNDDGVQLFNSPGQLGVRGDLRCAGKFIDGNSGTLAYNFFPQNGDMVIDTGDSFYNTTTGNSLRLRNVLAHEHGHGMGQLHVCPIQQTKLMEPTVSTAYDGPRHDDIRNAHRFYGDINEPDNDAGSATDLGLLSFPASVTVGPVSGAAVANGSVISIDANGEEDYFRFTVPGPAQATVTVTPIGTTYLDDVQQCSGASASCCSTATTDSLVQGDLAVEVLDVDGASVIVTASSQPAGVAETASNVFLTGAGEYFVRVFETGALTETQLYHITVSVAEPPFVPATISFPGGVPTELVPGVATNFDVVIDAGDEVLTPGSAVLSYRYDGGAFQDVALVVQSGDLYTATLPAAVCEDAPEFFVSVVGDLSGLVRSPIASDFTAIVGTLNPVADVDFEDGTGWTVASDGGLAAGAWQRGIPVNGGRGDPPTDFDGSGQCYLTDNTLGPLNDGNSDVDGGETRLTSPVYDLTGVVDPILSYARWYSNDLGDNPQTNTMTVEVSDNGGSSWTTLEVVGPTTGSPNPEVSGGWIEQSFDIASVVPLTSQFRVRFRVGDVTGAIVEAGVDALAITGRLCVNAPACAGDVNGDGQTNAADFTILAGNFGSGVTPGTGGDLNGDGTVNASDFTILAGDFGCGAL